MGWASHILGEQLPWRRKWYLRRKPFDAGWYWEHRYEKGGNSGPGSYGRFSEQKAVVVNRVITEIGIRSLIDFGCGDGEQLGKFHVKDYIGLDISATAVKRCIARYRDDHTKSFLHYDPLAFKDNHRLLHADLAISLEVIFHLVDDQVFKQYMQDLFAAADRAVLICSTDVDMVLDVPQRRHRAFVGWVTEHLGESWELARVIENQDPEWKDVIGGAQQHFYLFLPNQRVRDEGRSPASARTAWRR